MPKKHFSDEILSRIMQLSKHPSDKESEEGENFTFVGAHRDFFLIFY